MGDDVEELAKQLYDAYRGRTIVVENLARPLWPYIDRALQDYWRGVASTTIEFYKERRACDCDPVVGSDGEVFHRFFCASLTTREERVAARQARCAEGYHEDPDNSGLCIHCAAVLDPDDEGEDA